MTVKTSSLLLAFVSLAACSSPQVEPQTPDDEEISKMSWSSGTSPRAELAKAAPDEKEPEAPADEKEPEASADQEEPDAPAPSRKITEHAPVNYLLPELSDGVLQSPINIVSSRAVAVKHKVKFHYRSSKEHVDNLGHTIKVTYDEGSSLDYDGRRFDLVQFHFHTPSEHLLDGVTYPMEMHLVHAEHDSPEHLLVVGVLFKEGKGSKLLDQLMADVPEHAGEHVDKDAKLNAGSVLKRGEGFYHYEGSLTTPPYSETVTWLVLDQVHDASAEQIEAMNRIEGNNARHIQDQRARLIDHWH